MKLRTGRKLLAWLMVIMMLVMSIPAYAEEQPEIAAVLQADQVYYNPGDTVDLELNVTGASGSYEVTYSI